MLADHDPERESLANVDILPQPLTLPVTRIEAALVAMTGQQVTRRVYSAEELHRLRGSCSQQKLREAIEEHDGEDAELVKGKVCHSCSTYIIGP